MGALFRTMRTMAPEMLMDAFGAESGLLSQVAAGTDDAAFARPSPCLPWTVAELHAPCRDAVRAGEARSLQLSAAPGQRRTGPGMTAPPGACAREGVPWPMRRSPHGERRDMAPAGRYSMKAVI